MKQSFPDISPGNGRGGGNKKCLGEPTPYEGTTTDKVLFSRSETISNLQRFLWVTFQLAEKVLHKL